MLQVRVWDNDEGTESRIRLNLLVWVHSTKIMYLMLSLVELERALMSV